MFELSRAVAWLADPGHLAFTAVVLGVVLSFTRRWRAGRALLLVTLAASLVLQPLPLGPWLVRQLEGRFPVPTALPERIDGIVVLGGDVNLILVAQHGAYSLGRAGGQRLSAFADLARRHPEARLYYTGGIEYDVPGRGTWNEAMAARVVLAGLGVDVDRVVFEDRR